MMNTVIDKKEKKYVRHKTGDVQLFQEGNPVYDTSFSLYLPEALAELNDHIL